ncbi:MAG: hypothetical protein KDN19_22310 [Verrucomicrobiae bacterium]|nr:hypothetical protein [Verrucomicrobiae bacterium]
MAGYFIFVWLVTTFGAYGFAIPGVLVGLGATLRFGAPGWVAAICGVFGLCFGIFATWKTAPFIVDGSFGYFVTHLHRLPLFQSGLLVLGAGVAFWLPWRRRTPGKPGD